MVVEINGEVMKVINAKSGKKYIQVYCKDGGGGGDVIMISPVKEYRAGQQVKIKADAMIKFANELG